MGAKMSLFDPIGCCTTLQDDINNESRNKKEEIMTQDTVMFTYIMLYTRHCLQTKPQSSHHPPFYTMDSGFTPFIFIF